MSVNYRQAVINFCLSCKKGDGFAVGQCTTTECQLYLVRPNRNLFGKQTTDFTPDTYEQQVTDQLNLHSLARTVYETERD